MSETATSTIDKILARPRLIYAAAVGLFLADRALKRLVIELTGHPYGGRLVSFELFLNRGIAFSLPLPAAIFWPLAALAFTVLVGMSFLIWRDLRYRRLLPLLIIILLGAVSNLWDRLVVGATVDYLIFFRLSAINLADIMIIGGLLFLLLGARDKNKR
ncbi:MAG: signal peptidase II [Patescibacteria group bacterium]